MEGKVNIAEGDPLDPAPDCPTIRR
jgi:hypothetical protein